MPGTIIGCLGAQRSGKTLFAYKLVKLLHEVYDVPVYTNIYSPRDDFHYINSLNDFPLDLTPKIMFIDEIYNGLDAQDFKKLKEISIFINTIGKQNCLFVYTTIEAEMVYNRLRNQTQLVVMVSKNEKNLYYKIVNLSDMSSSVHAVPVNGKLFENVYYDTQFIPLDFDWSMKNWKDKLSQFYRNNYGIIVTLYLPFSFTGRQGAFLLL